MDQDETWHEGTPHLGHIVLDGDPYPPSQKGHSPQFSAHVCYGQTAGLIKVPFGTKVGLGPGNIVLDGNTAPLPKRGHNTPNFRAMCIVVKRLDGLACHLVWRQASALTTFC